MLPSMALWIQKTNFVVLSLYHFRSPLLTISRLIFLLSYLDGSVRQVLKFLRLYRIYFHKKASLSKLGFPIRISVGLSI
jgi:hypothetical protein